MLKNLFTHHNLPAAPSPLTRLFRLIFSAVLLCFLLGGGAAMAGRMPKDLDKSNPSGAVNGPFAGDILTKGGRGLVPPTPPSPIPPQSTSS